MTPRPTIMMVGPRPAGGWMSIKNYTEATAATAGTFADVETRVASWWAPRPIETYLDRRRGRQRLQLDDADDFDIVHFADLGLGHLVNQVRGARTVVTCHDLMPFFVDGFYAGRRDRLFGRALLRAPMRGALKGDRLLTVSECSARDICRLLEVGRERISVVGVPISHTYAPRPNAEAALRAEGIELPSGPKVMSIGDCARYKNLELLVRAMATPALSGAHLVRVCARLSSGLVRLAETLGVAGRVVELGPVSREAVVCLYSACDVVAQPSSYEGFGMPVAEAMACGTPVVCSDRGALPEVAGGATMVIPLDPEAPGKNPEVARAFGHALERAIDDELFTAELREKGLRRAVAFRPETLAPLLEAAYALAMGRAGTPAFESAAG